MAAENNLLERRRASLGPSYRLFYEEPVHLVRGEGVWLFDNDGKCYLDCYNNVASVGHCHPRVVEALSRQAATLNTHTRYLHENVVDYAERLTATLPADLDVCMFVCTGTEANDLAYRIAREVTGHRGIIVSESAYHGNSTTVFDMSTEDYPAADQPDHVRTVAAPCRYRGAYSRSGGYEQDAGAMEACAEDVGRAARELEASGQGAAMFICDNIFSSNGILTPDPAYLQNAYREIRAAGGLAVADEVQSGLCRLGEHTWGFEHSDVVPDIVTMGKPLGDGHPLAALVTTRAIAERFSRKFHYFNTFGGNPVSTAVGLAVLDVIRDEQILENVTETGRYLNRGLSKLAERYERIGDVRGKGLFYGLELVTDRSTRAPDEAGALAIRELMKEKGVLISVTGPCNNVLKIRPPMVFETKHADLLLNTLDDVL